MDKQFKNRVVLVTGGASGIGRSTAVMFAERGAKCVVADVSVQGGEETTQMIKDKGGEAMFVRTDVSKSADVEVLVSRTLETYGRLDFAHNNAAVPGEVMPTADWSEEVWDRTIAVNLKGIWLCMKYEIQQMLKQGSGAIVNTTSGAAIKAVPGCVGYNVCKAGILQLTRTAAVEYAKAGIRINALAPGATRTPMMEGVAARIPELEDMIKASPMGRAAAPEEIAEAVVWLCSDAASFVAGSHLIVDGGDTAT